MSQRSGAAVRADVVVIGAGLAGLAAARTLETAGCRVCVVEARHRVGGRTLSARFGDGAVAELGGQFVGPGQEAILSLSAELGLRTFRTFDSGQHLVELVRGNGKPKLGVFPGVFATAGFLRAQAALDRMARTVPLGQPWLAARAKTWDGITMQTWIRRSALSRRARALVTVAVRGVLATEPAEISLLHMLEQIRSAGGLRRLVTTSGGAQQDRFSGGAYELAEAVAAALTDSPMLGHPVRKVTQDDQGVQVMADGLTVHADQAIVAVPAMPAARIEYSPRLPAGREQLLARLPHGTAIKCLARYDAPFWRAAGLSGQVASAIGPVTSTFDSSPPEGSSGVLLGFVVGDSARALWELDKDTARDRVLDCFVRWFGDRARTPREFILQSWTAEEWTGGCYGPHPTPGALTSFGRWLREPHGRISWAGSETAEKWVGCMDGAVTSGYRAAREVLARQAGTNQARRPPDSSDKRA
ncbi:flavin monoamine oxidase family protein [Amycolatopsis sp. NPDC059090]|uniref:flavin monoamine oxidase family protein n=1 Tax=unclassified Amycolatopsis TaxID=2618356 RepID=UPI00367191EF